MGKKFSNICITRLLKVSKQEAQRSYKHGKEIFKDKEKKNKLKGVVTMEGNKKKKEIPKK